MWEHLEKQGVDTEAIKERINDLIVKTLLAVETQARTRPLVLLVGDGWGVLRGVSPPIAHVP